MITFSINGRYEQLIHEDIEKGYIYLRKHRGNPKMITSITYREYEERFDKSTSYLLESMDKMRKYKDLDILQKGVKAEEADIKKCKQFVETKTKADERSTHYLQTNDKLRYTWLLNQQQYVESILDDGLSCNDIELVDKEYDRVIMIEEWQKLCGYVFEHEGVLLEPLFVQVRLTKQCCRTTLKRIVYKHEGVEQYEPKDKHEAKQIDTWAKEKGYIVVKCNCVAKRKEILDVYNTIIDRHVLQDEIEEFINDEEFRQYIVEKNRGVYYV